MGGSSKTQTATTTNNPPAYAAPHLTSIADKAKGIYEQGTAFNPFPGSTVVPYDQRTIQSLNNQQALATGANPLVGATTGAVQGVLGGGGINSVAQPGINALTQYASGQNVNGGSQAFQQALDYQSGRTADDVNRQFSGMGRYGSGAHAGVLADRIGEMRNSAMAGEIARQEGQQLQAAGALGGLGQGANANLLQGAALAPTADQFRYSGDERLAQIGSQYEDLAARNMQDQIERYYATQQAPLANLGAYSDFVSGVSRGYGTQTQVSPKQNTSLAGGILGGALGGASIGSGIPLIGTGLGALGGGILGALGSRF
jgi:hypothetical protein